MIRFQRPTMPSPVFFGLVGLFLTLCLWHSHAMAKNCNATQDSREVGKRFDLRGSQVFDRQTNLLWERCSLGQRYSKNQCRGAAKLMGLVDAEDVAKKLPDGWRLPTLNELATLRKMNCKGAQINQLVFPSVVEFAEGNAKYWSSSRDQLLPTLYYNIDFLSGDVDANTGRIPLGVRFVRTVR
jgi:hypothetical protein